MPALLIFILWGMISCNNGGSGNDNNGDSSMQKESDSATVANTRDPSTAFPEPPVTGTAVDSSLNDTNFIQTAISSNRTEIALADLALRKSTNKDIKMMAQHLRQDHTQMLLQLNKLKGGGTNVDTAMNTLAKTQLDSLQSLSGTAFDSRWTDVLARSHQKTIDNMNRQLSHTDNAEVRNFINASLPKAQEHKKSLDAMKKS